MPVWTILFVAEVNSEPFAACCSLLQCWGLMSEGKPTYQRLKDAHNGTSLDRGLAIGWKCGYQNQLHRVKYLPPTGEECQEVANWHLINNGDAPSIWLMWQLRIINHQIVDNDCGAQVTYKLSGIGTRWVSLNICHPWTYELNKIVCQRSITYQTGYD